MSIEIPVTQAREHLGKIVEQAAREPVFFTRRGRRETVMLSAAEYERLLEADEDAQDLAAADEAMARIIEGEPTIPWEQVKADLGLA
jgi:antitoxin Phd